MMLLDEKSDDKYLKEYEILEEQIKSVDYDVWICNNCNNYKSYAYINKKSKYIECSHCNSKTKYLKTVNQISPATYSDTGVGEKTFECLSCKRIELESYLIPIISNSSSSSSGSSGGSSSSSGSSGGSFGGGSSGGGGSSSSW